MLVAMNELILDRQGRLLETPDFLAPVTDRERSIPRLLLMLILGLPFALVCFFIVMTIIAQVTIGHPTAYQELLSSGGDDRPLISYTRELSFAGFGLIALFAPLVAVAAWLYRRPLLSFMTAAPRFRWRMVAIGFAVAAPLVLAVIGLDAVFGDNDYKRPILQATSLGEAAVYAGFAVTCLFLAAFAEELLFRGWLLQQTSAFTRNVVILLLVNGVVFALFHGAQEPGAFIVRAIMGMGWCWIGLRLGGLEFATGAHLANNLAISLLLQPVTLQMQANESSDIGSIVAQVAIVVLTIAAVEYGLRRRRQAPA